MPHDAGARVVPSTTQVPSAQKPSPVQQLPARSQTVGDEWRAIRRDLRVCAGGTSIPWRSEQH